MSPKQCKVPRTWNDKSIYAAQQAQARDERQKCKNNDLERQAGRDEKTSWVHDFTSNVGEKEDEGEVWEGEDMEYEEYEYESESRDGIREEDGWRGRGGEEER